MNSLRPIKTFDFYAQDIRPLTEKAKVLSWACEVIRAHGGRSKAALKMQTRIRMRMRGFAKNAVSRIRENREEALKQY